MTKTALEIRCKVWGDCVSPVDWQPVRRSFRAGGLAIAYWLLAIRHSLFGLGYGGDCVCLAHSRTPFFTSNFTSVCEISYPRRYWAKSLTSLTSHGPVAGGIRGGA